LTPHAQDIGSDPRAATESAAGAGAPKAEIDITPAMIEAGADVVWRYFYDVMVYGNESGRELAIAVFQAMLHQFFSNKAKLEQKTP
jgi:hypothetical protein